LTTPGETFVNRRKSKQGKKREAENVKKQQRTAMDPDTALKLVPFVRLADVHQGQHHEDEGLQHND